MSETPATSPFIGIPDESPSPHVQVQVPLKEEEGNGSKALLQLPDALKTSKADFVARPRNAPGAVEDTRSSKSKFLAKRKMITNFGS